MAEQTSRLAIILDSSKAQRSTETLATALERLTREGESATASTDNLGFSFKRLASTAAGAMSIGAVIKMVDDWGQVAAQVKNTLRSVEGDIENYANVQERFLAISNRNGKDIEITQQLYIGAAKSMQELGYSTQQTIDYAESLSSAFTANATSSMAVESANNALVKSMITGTVAGDNWNAIMRAAPTLLGDIAKELERTNGGIKVTENEVKQLGADSKISFKLMADSIQHAKDANNALADSMDNTVADGFTRITNSAKAYYGELNQSLGITRYISASLAGVSDNFEQVSMVLTGLVGVGAARYLGNLSSSLYDTTKKSAAAALTNQRLATEQVNVTKATIAQIRADKAAALAAIESTKAQQAAATTEVQRISLKTQLANQTASLTALTHAQALATDELTAAKARLTSASSLAKSALGLIGGPTGAAMLAGGAIYYFYQKSQQAREEALAFADSIKGLRDNFDDMTVTALKGSISKAYDSIVEQQKEIGVLKADLMGLRDAYKLVGNDGDKLAEVQRKIDKKTQELEVKTKALEATMKFAADAQSLLNSKLNSAEEAFQSAAQNTRNYANALGAAIGFMNATAAAKRNLDTEMMTTPTPEEAYGGKDAAQYIKDMQKRAEIAAMADRKRAVEQAKYYAQRQGYNGDTIEQAGILAGIEFDAQQKRQQALKDSKAAATYSESAAQKMLSSLKEQQMALIQQRDTNGSLGSQQQALVKWEQQLADIKSKKTLTADQKSLLANAELITLEMKRNAEIEKTIQHREAEVKIASFHKQMMEEAEQAQKRYNQTIEMAGMGTLAQGKMQERFQIEAEFERKQADLQKQFQDKSTGMTEEMYKKETQFISDELQKRLAMLEDYHGKQDVMRGNWTLGVNMALQNYMDNARNYSQQAEGFITSSLQNITDGSADALSDIVTNSKNAFDAIGDFFGDLSKSIIKDLIRIAIQAQITNAVSGMFGGGGIFGGSSSSANAFSTGAYGNLSLTGMAHSGIDRVPETGTWLLEKGERVMTQDTSARLDKLLAEFSSGTNPDQYAMKYLHPANQTNNTTNNSSINNATETNENSQSTVVIHQTVNQTITVTGNGDKTLEKVVQIAIDKGSKKAIAEIQRDFATNGKTRKILER
ncbi:TPA: phage tail tape measure protein [Providencia rettgeri]|uniref:phage tail tape measure protein n=1 Tax=Providencia rettgeri TaxID=587 RepID=UPI0018C856DA|nr:phage tail tape measure protein [Providencia rettgeri]MBG5922551.1 phage tail tape measure protein [Providencia rettgeri]HEM8210029.1 phage tail tape measure protein [Providencia rettgeri]